MDVCGIVLRYLILVYGILTCVGRRKYICKCDQLFSEYQSSPQPEGAPEPNFLNSHTMQSQMAGCLPEGQNAWYLLHELVTDWCLTRLVVTYMTRGTSVALFISEAPQSRKKELQAFFPSYCSHWKWLGGLFAPRSGSMKQGWKVPHGHFH